MKYLALWGFAFLLTLASCDKEKLFKANEPTILGCYNLNYSEGWIIPDTNRVLIGQTEFSVESIARANSPGQFVAAVSGQFVVDAQVEVVSENSYRLWIAFELEDQFPVLVDFFFDPYLMPLKTGNTIGTDEEGATFFKASNTNSLRKVNCL